MSNTLVVKEIFRGLLNRDVDAGGLAHFTALLDSNYPLSTMLSDVVSSQEFYNLSLARVIPKIELPNLHKKFPDRYSFEDTMHGGQLVFHAKNLDDFDMFEALIIKHHFYDLFEGSYWPTMDVSKQVTAAMVVGLGAKSCLELGCFNGLVVGLLRDAGIDTIGVDTSHLSFVLAAPDIREHMYFGDILTYDFNRTFDVVLGMDVYEHFNPAKFPSYIHTTKKLLKENGFVIICSPMFGHDDVFGEVAPKYLREWHEKSDSEFWLDVHCRDDGWPVHGHLVWQSPMWWERQLRDGGLVRDREIERVILQELGWFYNQAPYRKMLFVLKHAENLRPSTELIPHMQATLRQIPRSD